MSEHLMTMNGRPACRSRSKHIRWQNDEPTCPKCQKNHREIKAELGKPIPVPAPDTSPQGRSAAYRMGFRRGVSAGVRMPHLPDHERGYEDGRKAIAEAHGRFAEEIGYTPEMQMLSVLR